MNRRLKTTLFAILPLFIAILLVAPALSQQKPGALKDAPSPEEKEDEGSLEDEAPPIGKVPTVEDIAKRQEKQKKKFQQLEALLHRLAEFNAKIRAYSEAKILDKTVRLSREKLIAEQFERVTKKMQSGRKGAAMTDLDQLIDDLQTLIRLLESYDRTLANKAEMERLREKIRQIEQAIRIQKAVKAGTEGGTQLAKLKSEQEGLTEKVSRIADELKREEDRDADLQDAKSGKKSDGKKSDGEKSDGEKSDGEKSDGEKSDGEKSDGEKSDGEKSDGEKSDGQKSDGQKSDGQKSDGEKSDGQKSDGQKSDGEKSDGQKSDGEKSDGQKSDGQKSEDQQSQSPVQQKIREAQRRMEQAQEDLEKAKREGAAEDQEQAIRDLETAKAILEELLRQLREEERAEYLKRLASWVQKMLTEQKLVLDRTEHFDKVPKADRTHTHEVNTAKLAARESEIIKTADKTLLLLYEDGTAMAMAEAVSIARTDMVSVTERLQQADTGTMTQTLEKDIIAMLEDMLEAIKKEQKKLKEQKGKPGQPQQGKPGDESLVDKIAELKMIRLLQIQVNNRTKRCDLLVETKEETAESMYQEVSKLAERQKRIAIITRNFLQGN